MNRKSGWAAWIAAVVVATAFFAVVVAVEAATYPPSSYVDPAWAPDWFKQCKQQKSWADWSFSQGPSGTPPTIAPDNEGWNWNFQRTAPYVTLTGKTSWVQGNVSGRTGVLAGGPGDDVHVWMDNEFRANWTKQVWLQADVIVYDPTNAKVDQLINLEVPLATGGTQTLTSKTNSVVQIPGTSWYTLTIEWETTPQPDWERVNFVLPTAPGGFFYIDNLKMATQCVPEPSTVAACLSLGAIGLIGFLRRRRG